MYRRESRPIYGQSRKIASTTISNSCVCPDDLMTMLASLHTVIDAFFPSFEGIAPITPGMKATATVSPNIFVRMVWFYRTYEKNGKRVPFPKEWEPNYAEEVLHIKDIYYEFEFDPMTDFLFTPPTTRSIVKMSDEEIDARLQCDNSTTHNTDQENTTSVITDQEEVDPNMSNTTTL